MKYLELYKEWMKSGEMDLAFPHKATGGLCGSSANFHGSYLWLFNSREDDVSIPTWWGWEGGFDYTRIESIRKDFTSLRQTILLFMAAMNNEL